ncbi:sugar 3,4-ketoisomerase [Mucilaginibacter ginkgonis]|uniref:FdtA/QdtA family cupin domain-containing protein n=1 Tax=Mucilaginibacter ginkgonis TaxID=2682091 RepID=A0A6I4HUC0_9SPHI|nr:FdtA/QdtA family cupin domain-containing protein [Mucilaginibacter ginkgonis]QQL50317.1 FdtA/QdtA family cupin domain-containing protein [Mucilaginibacter ginkgonis]
MAYIIELDQHADRRGVLTAIDNVLPFDIKRIYYIQDVGDAENRGGHRHFESIEAVVCLNGSLIAHVVSPKEDKEYQLSGSYQCLVLLPGDWHEFYSFSPNAILIGLSSTNYDKTDYATEPLTAMAE